MVSRREFIGVATGAIAFSGCFAPGGPKSRDLDLDQVTVEKSAEDAVEISAETDFVTNWEPDDAYHDISFVGFTEEKNIICREQLELGAARSATIEKPISVSCSEVPDYVTIAIEEESCNSTFFSVFQIAQTNSNYTAQYIGERQCSDSVTTIPNR